MLVAAIGGACSAGDGREPTPPVPTATLSPTTTLVSALPRQIGTDGGYQIFEVTAQQYQLIEGVGDARSGGDLARTDSALDR